METVLRKIRENQGLNQRELAEKSHMPQSLVSEIERGVRKPWPSAIKRISTALGMSSEALFPEEDIDD